MSILERRNNQLTRNFVKFFRQFLIVIFIFWTSSPYIYIYEQWICDLWYELSVNYRLERGISTKSDGEEVQQQQQQWRTYRHVERMLLFCDYCKCCTFVLGKIRRNLFPHPLPLDLLAPGKVQQEVFLQDGKRLDRIKWFLKAFLPTAYSDHFGLYYNI